MTNTLRRFLEAAQNAPDDFVGRVCKALVPDAKCDWLKDEAEHILVTMLRRSIDAYDRLIEGEEDAE